MNQEFLEAGRIINTHGVRGQVKIEPWSDEPDFLKNIKTVYISDTPYRLLAGFAHKGFFIAQLEGVDSVDAAVLLKNRIISVRRSDVKLEAGAFFLTDLPGLHVFDADSGEEIGVLREVLDMPSGNIYVVDGDHEILIPAVPAFIVETNVPEGRMLVRLIEGM